MSSQASIEEMEGSLEDIHANISLIAAIYSSGSACLPMDPSELQANANRAIDNMLYLKRSLDVKRQRATWELGVILHQNESQGATSITAAKAIYSQGSPGGQNQLPNNHHGGQDNQMSFNSSSQGRPAPKPSVKLRPRQFLRPQCFKRNTASTCGA